jgi:hypothetical protein
MQRYPVALNIGTANLDHQRLSLFLKFGVRDDRNGKSVLALNDLGKSLAPRRALTLGTPMARFLRCGFSGNLTQSNSFELSHDPIEPPPVSSLSLNVAPR